jgi:hypothetical protein
MPRGGNEFGDGGGIGLSPPGQGQIFAAAKPLGSNAFDMSMSREDDHRHGTDLAVENKETKQLEALFGESHPRSRTASSRRCENGEARI